jgi:Rrf2 family cysteine metabolism transcriptional repressor
MKVSAKEQHGLRAMAELAARYGEGPVPLGEVAEAQGISLDYLEQIVPDLRGASLLQSTRGARGGYQLARPPDEITVGQVLEALDGDILPMRCLAEQGTLQGEKASLQGEQGALQGQQEALLCDRSPTCAARTVWTTVYHRVVETLNGMTLADL